MLVPQKVCAASISGITAAAGFSPPSAPPPSAQDLIDSLRHSLAARVAQLTQLAGQTPGDAATPSAFEISRRQAVRQQQDFEDILAEVPAGFRLAPVLYSKVTREQNAAVFEEYSLQVRRRFLKFLADTHAGELAALGICPAGVARMKHGLDPVDAQGALYDLNIDHIAERSGGGQLSLQKEPDPLLPAGAAPTFAVNHFDNFILLPGQVHDRKNLLNDLQNAAATPPGQSRWVLMLVPETGPGLSGFVAPPQDPQHPLAGLHPKRNDAANKVNHAAYMADQALALLDAFRADPVVSAILTTAAAVAARQKKTVVSLVAEESPAQAPERRLTAVFNKAVAAAPAAQAELEDFLRPALEDLTRHLQEAFAAAAAAGHASSVWGDFQRFYRGNALDIVQRKIQSLPLQEAAALNQTLQDIDRQTGFDRGAARKKFFDSRQRGHKK